MSVRQWATVRLIRRARPGLLVLAGAISACLPIPHRRTRQAGGAFRVTTQDGRPVTGAKIYSYAGSVIGGNLDVHDSAFTDRDGRAQIPRRRAWHLFVLLLPDAEAPSVFGWCVEAPGFARLVQPLDDEGDQELDAPLVPVAEAQHCPASLDGFRLRMNPYDPLPLTRPHQVTPQSR